MVGRPARGAAQADAGHSRPRELVYLHRERVGVMKMPWIDRA